jgi:hypothetical protein
MRTRCLGLAVAVLLLSGMAHADSFLFTEFGYTVSFDLPASPGSSPSISNSTEFGWLGLEALVQGPAAPVGGSLCSFDVFFFSANQNMGSLSHNQNCDPSYYDMLRGGAFNAALWSGTSLNPTFIPGNYLDATGDVQLSILGDATSVPEGPELSMLGITVLGILCVARKRPFRSRAR